MCYTTFELYANDVKAFPEALKKAGINVMTNSSVERIDTSGNGVKAYVKTAKGEEVLEADILLSAVGIKTNIENIGLELFVLNEKTRWYCPTCGGMICVHKGYCLRCK